MNREERYTTVTLTINGESAKRTLEELSRKAEELGEKIRLIQGRGTRDEERELGAGVPGVPSDADLATIRRLEGELAFRAMKSSGFNIEDTHMRDMERIARLVAMVCMALVWAYLVGEHKDINIKPIRILKHGRKAKSLVKYGLEEIATILLRLAYTPKFDVFKFLSCT